MSDCCSHIVLFSLAFHSCCMVFFFVTTDWWMFTFSLYSSLMMEQFKMEEGSSVGRLITWVTVSFLELSTASAFSFRMSRTWTLLLPWAKKLCFSYRVNLGFTDLLERLVISSVTRRASPVKMNQLTFCHFRETQIYQHFTYCKWKNTIKAICILSGNESSFTAAWMRNLKNTSLTNQSSRWGI